MPDISLLEPQVLNGVIQRLPPRDEFMGLGMVPRRDWDLPVWEYDITSRRRRIARPNTPNSPAFIVDQQGIGKMQGSFIYTREKKVFLPTTIRWLRLPGELNRANAEEAVMREVTELTERIDRFHEYLIWKMLAVGSFDLTPLGDTTQINYGIAASHLPTVATFWDDPAANLVTDIQDFKRIISRDSDTTLTNFIGNGPTIDTYYRASQVQDLLNDAQKGAFALESVIPRFQGVNFREYDRGYVDDFTAPSTPVFVNYIPDGFLVGIAEGGEETFAMLDGPAADDEAPAGHIGRFGKTWKEKDPSARQSLVEHNAMPVLFQPDHMLIPRVF